MARRLQRPNVYLPVHLYGQLVHDKTGCQLLEAQVRTSVLHFTDFDVATQVTQIQYTVNSSKLYLSVWSVFAEEALFAEHEYDV